MPGYIKLYRDLQYNEIWQEKPFSRGQAWVDLLLMANHEDRELLFDGSIILVPRGSFVTSEVKLMDRWGWSKSKLRHFIFVLESRSMLVRKVDQKKTTLTITNYCVWQDAETNKELLKDHRKTTERLLKDTNKNVKNVKNDKKDIYISAQHLTMTKEEYEKLTTEYSKELVDSKIDYARNYKKLTNYKSLYLTLNNWLKSDRQKQPQQSKAEQKKSAIDLALEEATRINREAGIINDE